MIHQIRGGLYISDLDGVQTSDTSHIDRVVGVCQDSAEENVSCEYEHFDLADGAVKMVQDSYNPGTWSYELFEAAVDAAVGARLRRETVLVHCHAGVSRSAGVCIATIGTLDGIEYDQARAIVAETKYIQPSQEIIEAAKRYIDEH